MSRYNGYEIKRVTHETYDVYGITGSRVGKHLLATFHEPNGTINVKAILRISELGEITNAITKFLESHARGEGKRSGDKS